ncbi:MAG: peptidoglycan DD-metalloendopeptidase family protein [Leptolyngbyaceae cyanobacterium bins.59]|nr:peptidoglycan DD-metalloendopeptidase family protein [Leptolyngbyaceae cyanobacterium bins.59]
MRVRSHPFIHSRLWHLWGTLSLIGLLLVLCWYLLVGAVAQGTTVEELQQQQQQIEQQRSAIIRERDRLRNLQKAAEEHLNGLRQNIDLTNVRIQDSEYQLKLAKQSLKYLQEDLALATQQYQQRQIAAVGRLQYLQRQKGRQGWALLLQSRNLNQFLDRRYQLKLLYRLDRDRLAGLKQQADELKQQRLDVERQKNQVALLTQQLLFQKKVIESQAQSQTALVQRLRGDRVALQAAEEQLEKDSETVRELIQQRLRDPGRSETGIVLRGTGQMSYPNDGEISSGFGWRTHPILGYERFHAGVDFAADYGSTIRAADSGMVFMAGWYGGYGNTVILDHGNGITTLYAHASEVLVAEGQTVQRGEPIALVGSTGLSTGPHLHFEVRQDGEPVDPMSYL